LEQKESVSRGGTPLPTTLRGEEKRGGGKWVGKRTTTNEEMKEFQTPQANGKNRESKRESKGVRDSSRQTIQVSDIDACRRASTP